MPEAEGRTKSGKGRQSDRVNVVEIVEFCSAIFVVGSLMNGYR